MKPWIYNLFAVILVVLALFLRIYHIDYRAPFDWDQNRDILAISDIARGKPVLIGPVAKGEGGFLLGPLYYYVVTPVYLLMGSSPLALPITSAILDVLAIVAILVLLPKMLGRWSSLALAFMWSISWFAIEASRISWNVALLQLWLIIFAYLLSERLSYLKALVFGLTLGLTWHIHPSIIPLSLIVALFYLKRLGFNLKNIFLIACGYLLALSPLIIFDIRHSGLEHRLIYDFFTAKGGVTYPIVDVVISVFSRFGKNSIAILTASSDLHPWWGLGFTILSLIAILRGSFIAKLSGLIIIFNLALTIYLGEPGFPEYYLSASYLPLLVILITLCSNLKKLSMGVAIISLLFFSYLNLSSYTLAKTTFSLSQKMALAESIASTAKTADIRFDLPYGRDSGLPYLLKQSGVKIDKNASSQFVITESTADSIFIDGEIARELGYYGGFRLGTRVVQ